MKRSLLQSATFCLKHPVLVVVDNSCYHGHFKVSSVQNHLLLISKLLDGGNLIRGLGLGLDRFLSKISQHNYYSREILTKMN